MKFINYCRSCGSDICITRPAILAPFIVERIVGMKPETTTSLYGIPNQVNYFPCKTLMCEICGFVGINILSRATSRDWRPASLASSLARAKRRARLPRGARQKAIARARIGLASRSVACGTAPRARAPPLTTRERARCTRRVRARRRWWMSTTTTTRTSARCAR